MGFIAFYFAPFELLSQPNLSDTFPMMLSSLNENEMLTVGECLNAVANGPFFDDEEFQTLIGLCRNEVALIAKAWPDVDENDDYVRIAVCNSLNNLTGYPHSQTVKAQWKQYISATPDEAVEILDKLS